MKPKHASAIRKGILEAKRLAEVCSNDGVKAHSNFWIQNESTLTLEDKAYERTFKKELTKLNNRTFWRKDKPQRPTLKDLP